MPILPLPITKGVFKNVDATSVSTPDFATELKNLVIDDAGANIDRPGLKAAAFAQTGAAFGVIGQKYFPVSGTVVLVDTARRIWSMTSAGAVTEITGTTLGGSSRPVFASDGTYLYFTGGGAPQRWDGSGTTEAMAGSPPNCSYLSYLDGYLILFLDDDQEHRWAGSTAVARETWNSSNFFAAEGLPDNTKAQAVLLRELYSFGSESTEIFQNFGTSNPFGRTFFIDRGIGAPYSVMQADNTLWWLDDLRRVVRMEGRTPVQVSGAIDRVIQNYATVSDCWATSLEFREFPLALFVFPTEETSWVYDLKRQHWYEWDGFVAATQDRLPIHSHVYVKEWNRHLVGDPYTGIIRELSFDAKVDGGNALRRLRRMRYKHGTGQRKRSHYYLFHVKRGVGTPGGTEPVFEVRVNDDNRGWSMPRQVPLGFPGERQEPIRVHLGGIYRERQLEIQMTEPYEFQLHGIEEAVEVLG
jgi:hypothetical protein